MKKIGLLLGAIPGGGVFQYAQSILHALSELDPDEFSVVAAYGATVWREQVPPHFRSFALRNGLRERAIQRAWHMSRLPNATWRRVAPAIDANVRRLLRERCDLWICPSHERWAFRAPIPALGTVHDLMHIHESRFPEVSRHGEFEEREFHFRETCRWAKGILVDSDLGKRHLCDAYGVSPDRVFPLPYIAPAYIYAAASANSKAQRETFQADVVASYGLPAKFLFYPAQFWEHKNHVHLLQALSVVRQSAPDVFLVLVGSQRNAYRAVIGTIEELGLRENVKILGYVPDNAMAALYRSARALIMPSYFGPTNIPQLEAFASGCPVAVSDVYAVREQVGDAALLFNPDSVEQIAGCMRALWTDDALCAELVRKGHERTAAWGPPQFRERLRGIVLELTGSSDAARRSA